MNDITLITPPDKVYNKNVSIFLIYPTAEIKKSLQDLLAENNKPINVYLYDKVDTHDFDWLLSVHKFADMAILDLDNIDTELTQIVSYLISFDNTYWLTKGSNMLYNKISNKQIYNLDFLNDKLGGNIEKEQV